MSIFLESGHVSTYRMANHSENPPTLIIDDDKPKKYQEHGKSISLKWSKSENDPTIYFDGENLIFNRKLDFRNNEFAPDYLHRSLAEIAFSFLNDHKVSKGSPFRKELNDSLGRILNRDFT